MKKKSPGAVSPAGEQGFVGGFEGLLFGLLIFVAGTLLATHAWAVIDTKAATEAAARQATRTYVEAASPAAAAYQAQQAAANALAGYGRSAARGRVRLVSGSFGRCQRITIAVSYPSPVLMLPWVGRVGSAEWVRGERLTARRPVPQRAARDVGVRLTSRRTERGSVLILVPAGFLILVTLATLAVDSVATYLAQQQLHDGLAAAANDAVTAGLSNQSFYSRATTTIDPGAAARIVCVTMAAQSDSNLHELRLWMAESRTAVRLEGTATVDAVFGRAIPGFGTRRVKAAVQAEVTGQPALVSAGISEGTLVPLTCSQG